MLSPSSSKHLLISVMLIVVFSGFAFAQRSAESNDSEFGPVMTAYLGYLSNEQDVVDDRVSRREITAAYYRRNSNRIRALRQMAIHLVRQSGNDYVPELEAVTAGEMGTIFERPPKPNAFRLNEVYASKFRFLGEVHAGEVFYLFARLDPYEQADLLQRKGATPVGENSANGQPVGQSATRARRVGPR